MNTTEPTNLNTNLNTLENAQVQMRKGILELCVLSILARQETYAGDMLVELKAATLIVVEGTLYPLLNRLQKAGLLTYAWREAVGAPPRKYYQITPQGRAVYLGLLQSWTQLQNATAQILTPQTASEPSTERAAKFAS
ncbi:PadR family transcriptional regulator [Hugenholtzia roseola]|uniref:PadR family transcriptional regulator n=1 Tax=Hugenholtzia roseola TaxID=1002 RepID=UPI0006873E33|nr:PadR family transcriptional regulator [Hugenholtzia roseola]